MIALKINHGPNRTGYEYKCLANIRQTLLALQEHHTIEAFEQYNSDALTIYSFNVPDKDYTVVTNRIDNIIGAIAPTEWKWRISDTLL